MPRFTILAWLLPLFLAGVAAPGCGPSQAQPAMGPPPPPEVQVSLPVVKEVTDYEDFPGRTEAVSTIDVRAHVTGYLERVYFTDGAFVQKGDLLFEIDARPYRADLARAEGNVLQSEGHLRRLTSDYQRATRLLPQRAIGREEFDKIVGDHTEARGALEVAKAARDMAALNLGYTRITAPISGQISRRNMDPGNLVKQDDTSLTTIVSLDPIYAYFDLDERSTLRAQRLIRERKVDWSPEKGLHVLLGLADEEGFPHKGVVNFADNRVDPDTGTWRLRGIFQNRDHALTPGLFVRMRLPIGEPYRAILVAEQALSTDQGQKYVYVLDDAGKVAYRRITVGRLHGGMRVITDGVKPQDKVLVSGLQFVRPGAEVKAEVVPMPGDQPAKSR